MDPRILAQRINVSGKELRGRLILPGGEEATLGGIVSLLVQVSIGIAATILFLIFIWAGYELVTSRGEPQKIAAARNKITYGIVGFILLVASFLIIRIISQVFGLGEELFQ